MFQFEPTLITKIKYFCCQEKKMIPTVEYNEATRNTRTIWAMTVTMTLATGSYFCYWGRDFWYVFFSAFRFQNPSVCRFSWEIIPVISFSRKYFYLEKKNTSWKTNLTRKRKFSNKNSVKIQFASLEFRAVDTNR